MSGRCWDGQVKNTSKLSLFISDLPLDCSRSKGETQLFHKAERRNVETGAIRFIFVIFFSYKLFWNLFLIPSNSAMHISKYVSFLFFVYFRHFRDNVFLKSGQVNWNMTSCAFMFSRVLSKKICNACIFWTEYNCLVSSKGITTRQDC